MEKVRVAIIGLGCRGGYMLQNCLLDMDNMVVTAVCDTYQDRVDRAVDTIVGRGLDKPFASTDWHEVLDPALADAVLILSSWESHVPIAIEAMEKGIAVGMEVGGAYSIDQCWDMVRAYERTQTPFMFLENCCYGRIEMMVMNMIKQGLFGEIVHCEGGYCHDLREEVAYGKENRHYRLRNYLHRNCENYPTHELGPIAQILNINRGNRFLNLVSVASKSRGMNEYTKQHETVTPALRTANFAQGDVVTTIIKCANGETITLSLDTTLPRAYSRRFTVRGTLGMYMEDNNSVYLDSDFTPADHWNWSVQWNNAEKYLEKYEHPVWEKYLKEGIRGGHGGMDGLVYDAFIEAVRNGTPCPIDVYDAAAWMAVTPLSEMSIAKGGAPVEFPDFTNGAFCERE